MKHYEFVAKKTDGTLFEGEMNAVSMTDARTDLLKTGDYKQIFYLKESEITIDENALEVLLTQHMTEAETSFIIAAVHKAQNPFTRQRKPKAE